MQKFQRISYMKFTKLSKICISLLATLVFSCASTPKSGEVQNKESEQPIEEVEQLPSPAELYEQKVKSVSLKLISEPKQTTNGKIFTSPYVIEVNSPEGIPVESFELSVLYPASRENENVIFAETAITSDSEGKASFLPPVPEFSFNSQVTFFPKGDMTDAQIAKIASENTIKAPYQVQTNLKSAGGIIAIVDFNQNGKAITSNPISSSNLLMSLMKLGFTKIGNIDLTNQVLVGDDAKIQAKAKSIVGNNSNFLIYGTVKIDSNEKTDEGFSYTITGNIKSMNIKSGEVTFAIEKTISVTDKNDWNALATARKMLADELANEIKFGI